MSHLVTLLFNLPNLSLAVQLARHLSQKQIPATVMINVRQTRLLVDQSRTADIVALAEHDIGLLTDDYSHQLLPEIMQNNFAWYDGMWAAYDSENAAFTFLAKVFGRSLSCWGQAGHAWFPQINAALDRLNVPAVVGAFTRTRSIADLHWYDGSLVFPHEAIFHFDPTANPPTLADTLAQLQTDLAERIYTGARWSGICLSTPISSDQYDGTIPALDALLTLLTTDLHLTLASIAQLSNDYASISSTVYLTEIDRALRHIEGQEDIPTDFYQFSAAELLDLLVRVYANIGTNLETLLRRPVYGPIEEPPAFDPSNDPLYWSDFIAACRMVANYITDHQTLPANVFLRGVEWSVGAFFRLAVTVWPQFRANRPPNYVEWQPAYLYPAIGHDIAAAVHENTEAWYHTINEVRLNTLLMHTCFQCWTLKPAYNLFN